jgi:FKBP-type peptidyl-prolyl cis-trans isomerase FklB
MGKNRSTGWREMRRVLLAACLAVCLSGVCPAGEKPEPKDESDRIGYSIGYQIGGDFKRQGVELRSDLVVKGIEDALAGAEPLMAPEEMKRTLVEMKRKIVAAQQEGRKKAGEKDLAEGKAFLAGNAKKEGVATLPSGLQYKVLKDGEGVSPGAADNVTVHYRGTLIDGTEFDSSYGRGNPATFRVNAVIPGWTEALRKMKAGARWQLFIPSHLGYGERSSGRIPPNSTLIFEVELISVN